MIYQLVVRLFGNTNESSVHDGTIEQNGCGTFASVDERALSSIAELGATHVWLTGALRQATLTDRSDIGLPAESADVVKGRAGSFYAITDYYDVCPDYAVDPRTRMPELEALLRRVHDAGMAVLIDLVPNHVARGYGSCVRPDRDFGKRDDTSVFFARDNAFFYLVDPPGQALTLAKPPSWEPSGVAFEGRYAKENGRDGNVPRATGNNVTSSSPSSTDWYETVKLNYGYHFVAPHQSSYDPPPATWREVDAIIAYWQDKGVDGFRVDFAHWIPRPAWEFLIGRAKARRPCLFVAEAYEDLAGLLEAGFDAVYCDPAYDLLKSMYLGRAGLDDLDRMLGAFDDDSRGRYVHYLENHDERRIASPLELGAEPDSSGFGAANAAKHLAPILYLMGNGPILFYNGQEVGEKGVGASGFGGGSGRTSIFDYGCMKELVKWVNGGRYDGGRLGEEQRALRSWYADLLALAQAPEVRATRYWGLRYRNAAAPLFPFARFAEEGGSILVVVANFAPGRSTTTNVKLPAELLRAAGLDGAVRVSKVFDETGRIKEELGAVDADVLVTTGFPVSVPDQAAHVFRVTG